MTNYCFINGRYVDENKASVSVNDLGILRGYGVFDFLRTYNKKPFLPDEHIKRLRNSAKIVSLDLPYTDKQIKQIINNLIKKNKFENSSFKLVLTGGPTEDGLTPVSDPTFFILNKPINDIEYKKIIDNGVKLITTNYNRSFAESKTLNYLNLIKDLQILKNTKSYTFLYTHNKEVFECATSNIFIVKNNKLYTPKDGVLMGTTRDLVIKIANEFYEIHEESVNINDLQTADEIFITQTSKGIVPVVNIDGKKVRNGKPGVITKRLIGVYTEQTRVPILRRSESF